MTVHRSPANQASRLLTVSAPNANLLEQATDDLADRLSALGEADFARWPELPDSSSATGEARRAVLANSAENAARWLRKRDPRRVFTGGPGGRTPRVFLFSGVGDQYPGLGAGLYRCLPGFRQELDRCFAILADEHDMHLHDVLFPPDDAGVSSDRADVFRRHAEPEEIDRTVVAQPLLFALQYSLARALTELGAGPSALAGYSVGEYTAACVAGVFPLQDALRLVVGRARLLEQMPPGAMLAVAAGAHSLDEPLDGLLHKAVSLAALNGPQQTVLSGPIEAVEDAIRRLTEIGLACQRLATTHAYHSWMTEELTAPLEALVSTVPLSPPAIPLLSNLTGTWARDEEVASPAFWARQMSQTLLFCDELAEIWRLPDALLVEIGPGQALVRLALAHPNAPANAFASVTTTLPGRLESRSERELLLATTGRLWAAGASIDWAALTGHVVAPTVSRS